MERFALPRAGAAVLFAALFVLAAFRPLSAQLGHVVKAQKISSTSGGFSAQLDELDQFGRSIVNLGDMDGDGVTDLLVGAHTDDDGGLDKGSVYVLFLHSNGFVKEWHKISDLAGNFGGRLRNGDQFGRAAASLGDLDGDGVLDLAVSSNYDDDGGTNRGAVYILFLNADATVKSSQKISALQGGLPASLRNHDEFGRSITNLGDLDGDGVVDILVGTPEDDEGGTNTGALHVLFLNPSGTVKNYHRISKNSEGLAIKPTDWFGFCSANLGDFDGDGVVDVVVGSVLDDDGGVNQGSIWILFLNPDGSVKAKREIDELEGGLTAQMDDIDQFGTSVANLGDLDGDGVTDIGVGAVKDDDGGTPGFVDADVGAVYVLFMNPDASVKSWVKISDLTGDLPYALDQWDWFGSALAPYGNSSGDGLFNAVIGCRNDDDAGGNQGAIYMVQLNDGTVPSANFSASSTRGIAPLTVSFSDASEGEVTAWLWNFGDGPMSNLPAPTKTYDLPGSYDVQLTVRGPGGIDVETKRDHITVTAGVLAGFDATPRAGPCPLEVRFDDHSQGLVTSWAWDFGDGTTSSAHSPSHVYTECGNYVVSLMVSGPQGTDTLTLPDFVVVAVLPPQAGFTASPTAGAAPLGVQFLDASTGTISSWAWDFGDGYTSSLRNPLHVYGVEGLYSVSLTTRGPGGSDTRFEFDLVTVGAIPPVAGFDATPTSGPGPLTVVFSDQTTGVVTSWVWDFGDGGTASDQNPVHVYTVPGVYGVTLTASGPGGSDTLVRSGLVTVVVAPPGAAFNATPTTGTAPLAVQFSDLSTSGPTGWSWDFGDGTTSTLQHPDHVYANAGVYTVSLTVSSPGGSDSLTLTDLITASPPPTTADFTADPLKGPAPLVVIFNDASSANVTSWSWDFGDGASASGSGATHVYSSPGTYTVSLAVQSPTGTDSRVYANLVTAYEAPPEALFTALPSVGSVPLVVQFDDQSTGSISAWSWTFGDGASANVADPVHTYGAPGAYTVSLTVVGPGGSSTLTQADAILVAPEAPLAAFDAAPLAGTAPLAVQFSDLSTSGPTGWSWDLGDGTTSTLQHPEHVYANAGVYTVTLTVSSPGGSDSLTLTDLITASVPTTADFTADPLNGPAPLVVIFNDASSANVTSWSWDFGDGASASGASATHVYSSPGTYTVSLAVQSPTGTDSRVYADLVTAYEAPPEALFTALPSVGSVPLVVQFDDQSTGSISAWSWTFGDGASANVADPVHTYGAPGAYTVSLTVVGPGGSSTLTSVDAILVAEGPPLAAFDAAPLAGTAPLAVQFSDTSTGVVSAWSWSFGDGTSASARNPAHTYTSSGTYTVTLTASGPGGADDETKTGLITVAEPPPIADFTAAPTTGFAPLAVQFTDASTGWVTSRTWDFGDGTSSNESSPAHVYASSASYTVTFSVSGPGGSNAVSRPGFVQVSALPPVADFSGSPRDGYAPLLVAFTDLSTGEVTQRSWSFGDGQVSTEKDPVHEFAEPGTYAVLLEATGPGGTSGRRRTVVAREPPSFRDGSFEQQVVGTRPVAPWTVYNGASVLVRSSTQAGDQGFPSDGANWCDVGAEGTGSARPPSNPRGAGQPPTGTAGVQQAFQFPVATPHLFFEAAFLLNGAQDSVARNDFMSIDLSDGVTVWNLFYADSFSDFPLVSSRTLLPMTALERVHADLESLFPSADESTVLTLRVSTGNFGGSVAPSRGYVDALRFAPSATATFRNGLGKNPAFYVSSPAVLGGDWTIDVDATRLLGTRMVVVTCRERALAGVPGIGGEVLIGGPLLSTLMLPSSGELDRFVLPVPDDPSLIGRLMATQAMLVGKTYRLGNAYDLRMGY